MRWPIQLQLLLPMLSVVVLAIALTSAAGAYLGMAQARRQQEENLSRVVATLSEAPFPPTESVLRQVSGLSGAEFALLDEQGTLRTATLSIATDELPRLRAVSADGRMTALSTDPAVSLGGWNYLGHRVKVASRRLGEGSDSLVVLYREDRWRGGVRQAVYPAMFAGLAAAAVAVLFTTSLARRFVRPIRRLGGQTAVIAGGDFQPVAVPPRDDEIRDLALSINHMAERLSRYESDVRQNERLRTLGQLGAGLAHQLRNAATGARLAIELHQRGCPQGADESLAVALRQLRLMESYLQRFLDLGRSRPAKREPVDLASLAADVIELVRPACVHGKIDLKCPTPSGPLEVLGDRDALRELLVNLVLNAIEAAGRHRAVPPRVVVEVARQDEGRAVLRVKDTGPGPGEETAGRLFEPFVTEKPEGTGLGLYVARQIAEDHQGTITWRREDGMTCFTVELPLVDGPTTGVSAEPPS